MVLWYPQAKTILLSKDIGPLPRMLYGVHVMTECYSVALVKVHTFTNTVYMYTESFVSLALWLHCRPTIAGNGLITNVINSVGCSTRHQTNYVTCPVHVLQPF